MLQQALDVVRTTREPSLRNPTYNLAAQELLRVAVGAVLPEDRAKYATVVREHVLHAYLEALAPFNANARAFLERYPWDA